MKDNNEAPAKILQDPNFKTLQKHVIDITGLCYFDEKEDYLAAILAKRFEEIQVANCDTYLKILTSETQGETEFEQLIKYLTIGETYFFRHVEQFDSLREFILPAVIEKNRDTKQLRIWSAACSYGAEPYSIAILLKEHFSSQLAGWDIKIIGTDINRHYLEKAEEGKFADWSFRLTHPDLRHNNFTYDGQLWTILPELKKWVSFQYHNLVKQPFRAPQGAAPGVDIIFCRNVMIYFGTEIIEQLGFDLAATLLDKGWLVCGHAEYSFEDFGYFEKVQGPGGILFYQKLDLAQLKPPHVILNKDAPNSKQSEEPYKTPKIRQPKEFQFIGEDHFIKTRDLFDRNDFEGALRELQLNVKSSPLDPLFHFYLALAFLHLKRIQEAENALLKAIYLKRDFIFAYYYLGIAYEKNKKYESAQKQFQNALRLLEAVSPKTIFFEGDGTTAFELIKIITPHLGNKK